MRGGNRLDLGLGPPRGPLVGLAREVQGIVNVCGSIPRWGRQLDVLVEWSGMDATSSRQPYRIRAQLGERHSAAADALAAEARLIIRVLGDGRIALSRGMGCLTSYGRVPPCYRMLGCNIARGSRYRAGVAISRASCDITFFCVITLWLCALAVISQIFAISQQARDIASSSPRIVMRWSRQNGPGVKRICWFMLRWAPASKPDARCEREWIKGEMGKHKQIRSGSQVGHAD